MRWPCLSKSLGLNCDTPATHPVSRTPVKTSPSASANHRSSLSREAPVMSQQTSSPFSISVATLSLTHYCGWTVSLTSVFTFERRWRITVQGIIMSITICTILLERYKSISLIQATVRWIKRESERSVSLRAYVLRLKACHCALALVSLQSNAVICQKKRENML